MKKNLVIFLLVTITATIQSQILYVPSGTAGIGNNTTNQNVGIGVAAPSQKLEVNGSIFTNINGSMTNFIVGGSDPWPVDRPTFQCIRAKYNTSTQTKAAVTTNDALGAFFFGGYDGANFQYGGALYGYVDGTVASGSVPTRFGFVTGSNSTDRLQRMVIKANGKIGIGTENPSELLEVNGTVKATAFRGTNNSTIIGNPFCALEIDNLAMHVLNGRLEVKTVPSMMYGDIIADNNITAGGDMSATGSISGASLSAAILTTTNISSTTTSDLNLQINGTTRLSILNSNGYVGIGTGFPSAPLTVKGKIVAGQVEIKEVGTIPDYVFKAGYQLRSISELERYIIANSHLPEIPSAREFEENGMNIADMNNLLLKKVEELTLYMIELNKKVEKLEKENEVLKSK